MKISARVWELLFSNSISIVKGGVSIRGFSWYLNISIIFWEQIATYRGHASLKTLNQIELWFRVYFVLKAGGIFIHQSCRR